MDRRQFINEITALGVAVTVAGFPGLVPQAWAAPAKTESRTAHWAARVRRSPLLVWAGFTSAGRTSRRASASSALPSTTASISWITAGITMAAKRNPHGQGPERRLPPEGFPDDQNRWAHRGGRHQQIEESLKRLQTDTIDLLQFHELIRMSDPDRIFAPGGAYEAMLPRKKAGKIRYIGFTGHKSPAIHLKMLELCFAHNFTPATVQMPLNLMDAHYDSFQKQVLPVLLQHGIGPLAMKSMGDHFLLESKTVTPMECLHYDMNLPVAVVITGCDSMPILEQALTAARTFRPLSAQEVAALLAKTAKAAARGRFELYKTSDHFDSTARNPQWLG